MGVVAIHAINGMPGVGKTALAVHIGHLVADRFPGGQLFVDLRAHSVDQAPAEPAAVLATLLSATGVAPEHIPDGEKERAARWRDQMAGKRVLLVLDNAASDEQVEPLLPNSAGCLVLVTSRRRLAGLRRDYGAANCRLGSRPKPTRSPCSPTSTPMCDRSRPASRGGTGEIVWPPAAGHHHRRRRGRHRRAHERR